MKALFNQSIPYLGGKGGVVHVQGSNPVSTQLRKEPVKILLFVVLFTYNTNYFLTNAFMYIAHKV